MDKISVIIPVHNVKEYLEECINSVINQTYNNLEIILIDDGSNDGSELICDELAKHDSRIIVIHQKASGPSKARNTALEIFTGDYFTFVDSDDIISVDFCQILHSMLANTTFDFSACRALRFIDGSNFDKNINNLKPEVISISKYLKMQYDRKFEFGAVCKLYKRNIGKKLLFKNGKLNEDVYWAADLLKNNDNGVIITDDILYYYRQKRAGSIMTNQAVKASADLVSASNYLTDIVLEKAPELTDRAISYGVTYPLQLIDKIIVQGTYKNNKAFLNEFSIYSKKHFKRIIECDLLNNIQKSKIKAYKTNRILLYINGYCRLIRVYAYKLLKKDPYKDGHGI